MQGFSLIEVLAALIIFAVGLLAIALLQASAVRVTQAAHWHSLAVIQASNLFERLRVNQSVSARHREKEAWNKLNAILLPKGQGDYQCAGQYCHISIRWQAFKDVQQLQLTVVE